MAYWVFLKAKVVSVATTWRTECTITIYVTIRSTLCVPWSLQTQNLKKNSMHCQLLEVEWEKWNSFLLTENSARQNDECKCLQSVFFYTKKKNYFIYFCEIVKFILYYNVEIKIEKKKCIEWYKKKKLSEVCSGD